MIKPITVLTGLVFASLQTSWASEAGDKSSVDYNNRLVVTAERKVQSESQVKGSVTLLDDALELIQANHLNEISGEVPGLWISKGNGQEHLTAIRSPVFTGPGSCAEFMMLQNSVPLRAKGFCNVNQLFESFFEQATQIEVVRGTHSAFFGSDAVHGVINIDTQQLKGNAKQGQQLNWTLGDFGFARVDYALVGTDQAFQWSGSKDSGVKRQSGVDQQKLQYESVFESQHYSFHTLVSATHLNQETAGYLQRGEAAYRDPSNQYVNEFPEAYRDAESLRLQSTITPLASQSWSLTPYLRYTDMSFLMHFLPGQPIEDNGHYSVGIKADMANDSDKVSWRYGIDAELTRGYLQQAQSSPTNTGIAFLDEVLPVGQHYDFAVNSIYLGSFVALDWALDDAHNVSSGLRLDYLRYDYNNRMLSGRSRDDGSACGFGGCRYTRPDDRSDDFSQPSAFLSYAYRPNKSVNYYVKLDTGYRAPQVTEMYRLQNGQTTADLKPQQVTSFETGVRFHADRVVTSLAAFVMQKDNVIYQNTDRAWVYNATTEHTGLEWSADFSLSEHWFVTTQWTWAKHRYTSNSELTSENFDGNDMDTAPRHMGGLALLWTPTPKLEVRTGVRKIGQYYLNPENTESYPGHTSVSLGAAWQLSSQTRLNLKVHNLTDRRYADRADFAFGQHRYFVAEPRRVFLGMSLQLD